jgi:hypothetical protein
LLKYGLSASGSFGLEYNPRFELDSISELLNF